MWCSCKWRLPFVKPIWCCKNSTSFFPVHFPSSGALNHHSLGGFVSSFFPVHTLLWRTHLSNWFCNCASHGLCVHIECGRPFFWVLQWLPALFCPTQDGEMMTSLFFSYSIWLSAHSIRLAAHWRPRWRMAHWRPRWRMTLRVMKLLIPHKRKIECDELCD